MKKNRGFTLVEIIVVVGILVVIAGIFSVNMISTLNKNKKVESNNVVSTIKSAADAYVSANQTAVEDLYNGYGYVDLTIGELKDAGLIGNDLIDSETGEKISDTDIVRARLESEDIVTFTYPVDASEITDQSYELVAQDLYVDYSASTSMDTWCSSDSNKFAGLNLSTGLSDSTAKSKLYLEDRSDSGAIYTTGSYRNSPVNLQVTACNVNPQLAGTYQILYQYNDPITGVSKTTTRTVYVGTSTGDVLSFTVVINNGNKIIRGTADSSVPVKITQTTKAGTTYVNTTVYNMHSDANNTSGYIIENFSTSTNTDGTPRTATISYNKTNSDGSKPSNATANYTVTDELTAISSCSTSSYCKGSQSGNYVKYLGTIYRIYYIDSSNKIVKIIYNGNDISSTYGQIGECTSTYCCNGGRYVYTQLGDSSNGLQYDSLDTVLNTFANTHGSINSGSPYIELQYVNSKSSYRLISLLTKSEYQQIGNCSSLSCSSNYLSTSNFWLLDSTGNSAIGNGSYNYGNNEAYVYNYAVISGNIKSVKSSYKDGYTSGKDWDNGQLSSKDFYYGSIKYVYEYVKPVIQLKNPRITKGTGTSSDPYVIG